MASAGDRHVRGCTTAGLNRGHALQCRQSVVDVSSFDISHPEFMSLWERHMSACPQFGAVHSSGRSDQNGIMTTIRGVFGSVGGSQSTARGIDSWCLPIALMALSDQLHVHGSRGTVFSLQRVHVHGSENVLAHGSQNLLPTSVGMKTVHVHRFYVPFIARRMGLI